MNKNLYDISPNFPYPAVKQLLSSISLLVEFITLFHVIIVAHLITKSLIIHKNLKFISYNLWFCIIVKCCANIIVHTNRLFSIDFILPTWVSDTFNIVREVSTNCMVGMPPSIVIERMFSIFYAKTYEKWFSWKFVIVVCGIHYVYPIWVMINKFYLQSVFPLTYSYGIADCLMIVLYTIYFKSHFATVSKSVFGLTLSERYQRAVNKASYGAIIRVVITAALITVFSSLYLVMHYILPYIFFNVILSEKESICRRVFELCVSICICVLPYNFAHIHPSLKKQYRKLFQTKLCKSSKVLTMSKPTPSVFTVQSATGHNLNPADETSYYFRTLSDQWNSKLIEIKGKCVGH